MKLFAALVFALTLSHLSKVEAIVNGFNITYGYFRYVALLKIKFSPLAKAQNMSCTGSYIGKNWIVTAGHCVTSSNPTYPRPVEVKVYMNSTIRYGGIDGVANNYYLYNKPFNFKDVINDIALISVTFNPAYSTSNYPTPVKLPPYDPLSNYSSYDANSYNSWVVAAFGWGHLGINSFADSPTLTGNYFLVIPNSICTGKVQRTVISDQFCLQAPAASLCRGDSGGPAIAAVAPEYLLGVVSYGVNGSCNANIPTVYTRLTSKYLNWIFTITKIYTPL